MGAVFTVKNGQVSVNQTEYRNLYKRAWKVINQTMAGSKLKYLPVDRFNLATRMAWHLFYPNGGTNFGRAKDIGRSLTAKLPGRDQVKRDMASAVKGKLDWKLAKSRGYFGTGLIPKFSCPSKAKWKEGLDYYSGSPNCDDAIDTVNGKKLPAAMYTSRHGFKATEALLNDEKNWRSFFKKKKLGIKIGGQNAIAPLKCTGPGGEKAVYNYPYESFFWDLIYVIGTGKKEYKSLDAVSNFWYLLPKCSVAGHSLDGREKLLFNFGSRTYLGIDIMVNGKPIKATIVINYIASTTEASIPRSKFMKKAPKMFFGGEFAKKHFLDWRFLAGPVAKKGGT